MQVIGYETAAVEGQACLVVDDDGVRTISLAPGAELDYGLGERHCAGTMQGGHHVACDAERAPYCLDHASTWVCAKCTGDCLKDEMDCYEEHAVYLAGFAPDTWKVGVTRSWRLETRLREQGADRAAHIRTVDTGKRAREIEAGIAETVRDRVRVPRKIRGFGAPFDDATWADFVAPYDPIETFDFDYGLDLASAPVPETLASGTVRGTKGRVLLVNDAGTTYAVDIRDLVGYDLDAGGATADRQSSLAAFD